MKRAIISICSNTGIFYSFSIRRLTIVSFERYDKKLKEFESEIKFLNSKLIIKSHIGVDIKEYFEPIYEYLKSQKDIDEKLIKKANDIYKLVDELEKNIIHLKIKH